MYTDQQYKKDLEFIEKIDKNVSSKVVFFLYFFPLIACLAAHVLYLVLFNLADIHSMVKFNIGSVSFYALLIIFARFFKEKLNLVYASMIEIILHAVAATVCVGLKPDFCMFLLMIIPLAFLVPNKKKYIPFIIMFISVPSYGILRFIYLIPGRERYDMNDSSYTTVFYVINILVGSFVLIYVAMIFTGMHRYNDCKARIQNEQLRTLASTDPLTKLNNRREMGRILNDIVNISRVYGTDYIVGICDIDDFKKVNDSLGHDCGDVVLKEIARVLTSLTRENDFLCRWGGEEFLILLNQIERNTAKEIAERFRAKISEAEIRYKDTVLSVTMTFGVSDARESDSYESMFRLADNRLYEGKENGKNQVV